jgi:anti-anti-sigma regulatory factor
MRIPRAAAWGEKPRAVVVGGAGGSRDGVARGVPRELEIHPIEAPHGWRLVGDLSSENAHLLAAMLAHDGRPPGDVTLDLADLTFVDTIGLHVIARAAADLGGDGRLTLRWADPWLHKVLLLSGIDAFANVDMQEVSS